MCVWASGGLNSRATTSEVRDDRGSAELAELVREQEAHTTSQVTTCGTEISEFSLSRYDVLDA